MHIHEFAISTKKGDVQPTRWLILQDIPYPNITCDGGGLKWRNFDGLFSQYQSPARGLADVYTCNLLVPGIEIPEDYNRTHFAGFTPYSNDGTTKAANPGSILFRGQDLGEMRISIEPQYAEIRANDGVRPPAGAVEMINAQIVPRLRNYIEQNRGNLKAEAIAKVKAKFAAELAEARAQLDKLQEQAKTAKF
jgi:hypothetical protein